MRPPSVVTRQFRATAVGAASRRAAAAARPRTEVRLPGFRSAFPTGSSSRAGARQREPATCLARERGQSVPRADRQSACGRTRVGQQATPLRARRRSRPGCRDGPSRRRFPTSAHRLRSPIPERHACRRRRAIGSRGAGGRSPSSGRSPRSARAQRDFLLPACFAAHGDAPERPRAAVVCGPLHQLSEAVARPDGAEHTCTSGARRAGERVRPPV